MSDVKRELDTHGILVRGILHVGAHHCEELEAYEAHGIPRSNVVWIDALEDKVNKCKSDGIPNVYCAVVSDKDNETVTFHVANNGQSSSFLDLKTHATQYPGIKYVSHIRKQTITLKTFFSQQGLDTTMYNFWNFDIQGAELKALHGASDLLKTVDALYLEVNEDELYAGCGLIKDVEAYIGQFGFQRVLYNLSTYGWGDALYIKKLE